MAIDLSNLPQTPISTRINHPTKEDTFARKKVSDIICTSRGMNRIFPEVRTVLDMGGQSTRAMRIDPEGRIANFTGGEKCAAGSA